MNPPDSSLGQGPSAFSLQLLASTARWRSMVNRTPRSPRLFSEGEAEHPRGRGVPSGSEARQRLMKVHLGTTVEA